MPIVCSSMQHLRRKPLIHRPPIKKRRRTIPLAMERAIVHIGSSAEAAKASVEAMEKQRGVMQEQLDTMKGQLELEHRPWVAVNVEPSSPIVFDERGCVLMCKVTMTNVGRSVAKHVSLWTDFALLGTENPIEVRDKLCDIMRQPQNESSDYGWLLFPNQSAVEQRPLIASPERVKKALENKTFQGMNAIGLHLVGCVDYPSLLGQQKRHQTRFVYNVSFIDTTRGASRELLIPPKKCISPLFLHQPCTVLPLTRMNNNNKLHKTRLSAQKSGFRWLFCAKPGAADEKDGARKIQGAGGESGARCSGGERIVWVYGRRVQNYGRY